MFKDEVAGKQITYFVGLRPKLYSFEIEETKEVRKCKGIKKNVIKKGNRIRRLCTVFIFW